MDVIKLKIKDDPIERDAEKGCEDEELSPMDPPEANAPPGEGLFVPFEEMHPALQHFRTEHELCVTELGKVELALERLQKKGPDEEANQALSRFFNFLEKVVLPHSRQEEKVLFPLLERRLIESGEHSDTNPPTTGVDVLEADHLHVAQLSAVMLNFFGVAGRLPDQQSQRIILEAGIEQGKALVDLLRTHITREDDVIFSLAHKLITTEEFDQMCGRTADDGG